MNDALSVATSEVGSEISSFSRFPKIHLAKPKTPNIYYPPDFPVQMRKVVMTQRESGSKAPIKVSKPQTMWTVDGNNRFKLHAQVNRLDRRSLYNNDPKKHEIPPEYLNPRRRRSTVPSLPKIQLNPNQPHNEETPSPGPFNNQMFIQTMNKPTKLAKALEPKEDKRKSLSLMTPVSTSIANIRDRRVSVFDIPAPFQAKRCRKATMLGDHYCEILGPTSCSCCIEKTNKDTADKIQRANLVKPPQVTSKSLVAPFLSFALTKNMFAERLRTAEQVKYVEHLLTKRYNTPKFTRWQKLRPIVNVMSPEVRFNYLKDNTDTFSYDSIDDSVVGMSPPFQRKGQSRRESRVSFDFHPPTEYVYVPWD